jgi:hypothetical protein
MPIVRSNMGSDIDQYIQQWEVIVDKYVEHRKQTMALNPSWPEDDFRLALYGLSGNLLVTGLLGAKMIRTCLLSTAWWDANIEGNRTLSQRQHQTDQYVVHAKVGVYVLFFSMLEAVLRQLLRELEPGACNNAYDAFVNVYRPLLKHVAPRTPFRGESTALRRRAARRNGCGDCRRDGGPYHGRQAQRRQAQGQLGAGHGLPPVPLDGLSGEAGRGRALASLQVEKTKDSCGPT